MRLTRLRISNFQSFGEVPTEIELSNLTYILGPNGAGKTAVLQAVVRLFGANSELRRVKTSDFHVKLNGTGAETIDVKQLWIESDFDFPEASDGSLYNPTIPPLFAHMQLKSSDGDPRIRIRLTATLDSSGDIEERIEYIVLAGADEEPEKALVMSKYDRSVIQVHYLPARRNPSDQVSYAASSLIGRALRAANWSEEKEEIDSLTDQINAALEKNKAMEALGSKLEEHWGSLHSGAYLEKPALTFARAPIENLLRQLGISFTPSPDGQVINLDRLSDGQQSLLYMSLVLAMHSVGRDVLAGKSQAYNIIKLRPAVFTIIAVEEPENSLSPRYLGRVIKALREASRGNDAQGLIATHSPALLRRVAPEDIRYLRLNENRETSVRSILLPAPQDIAHKFVREAVQAFPEVYFARLVILGEGDSEEIVLPRILDAKGIAEDDASVVVAPLGGRHVNHFWRLLHGLAIPHVTLLDLDFGRYQAGWGRISYAAKQLKKFSQNAEANKLLTDALIGNIPKWNSNEEIPAYGDGTKSWIAFLEAAGVYFSHPIDLDFMMLETYPAAYMSEIQEVRVSPGEDEYKAVLGKSHRGENLLGPDRGLLFAPYHKIFNLGSKPTAHIQALSALDNEQLLAHLPAVLGRLTEKVQEMLVGLPE